MELNVGDPVGQYNQESVGEIGVVEKVGPTGYTVLFDDGKRRRFTRSGRMFGSNSWLTNWLVPIEEYKRIKKERMPRQNMKTLRHRIGLLPQELTTEMRDRLVAFVQSMACADDPQT